MTKARMHSLVAISCAALQFLLACGQPSSKPAPPKASAPAEPSKPKIPYDVVDERKIPNGGYARVIVVGQASRTEQGILDLADQLRRDTSADRNAFIFIYDDKKAASMRDAALSERLKESDLKFHDSHMIGSYMRNANSGFHSVTMALKGTSGPMKEVPLQ